VKKNHFKLFITLDEHQHMTYHTELLFTEQKLVKNTGIKIVSSSLVLLINALKFCQFAALQHPGVC